MVTVDRKGFTSALTLLQRVTERRQTLPILDHVLIRPEPGRIFLAATNLCLSVWVRLPTESTDQDPAATAPVRPMLECVRALPRNADTVELHTSATENGTKVECHGATFTGFLADEFPVVSPVEPEKFVSLPGLLSALGKVAPAVSTDVSRTWLNGAALFPGRGHVVASDGHRLHLAHVKKERRSSVPWVIRGPMVRLLTNLPRGVSAEDRIALTGDKIAVPFNGSGHGQILAPPLTGEYGSFPNYPSLIPNGAGETTFTTELAEILGAARRAVKASPDRSSPVELALDNGSTCLKTVNTEAWQDQTVQLTLPLKGAMTGTPLRIGLNARYLVDLLEPVAGLTVTLSFQGPTRPIMVRDHKSSVPFLGLLMPQRV